MLIGGLQKLTLIDYPDKIAATVFLIGCNFFCPWCYNPELVLSEAIKKCPKISEKYFFDFLKKRKGLLEGVVICGGEPTINKELPDFIKKIKKLDYLVKLDTNGSNPEMVRALLDAHLLDYFAMDIKTSIALYPALVGDHILAEHVSETARLLIASGVPYEFRTTMIREMHTDDVIHSMAQELDGARLLYLQEFRPQHTLNPAFEKYHAFSHEEMEGHADKIFRKHIEQVVVRR